MKDTIYVTAREGGALKKCRIKRGLTQRQVAVMMGLAENNYTMIEAREPKLSTTLKTLDRFARSLGMTLVYGFRPADEAELNEIKGMAEAEAEAEADAKASKTVKDQSGYRWRTDDYGGNF